MLLSILTGCHNAGVPSPELSEPPTAHYVKASSKRFSVQASPVKKRNSRLKRKSVVIGSPSGFRHEFHLGRDVNSMSELWDLERWREEIESRVQEAAAQHAAINAAAAASQVEEEAEASKATKRPRPQSMIKRKPVPSLETDEPPSAPADVEPPVPPMPSITVAQPSPTTQVSPMSRMSTESSSINMDDSFSSCGHGSDESEDTSSIMSSLPPSTPPSTSPRTSTDLKYVDETTAQLLAPVVALGAQPEISEDLPFTASRDEIFTKAPTLANDKSRLQHGDALSDAFESNHHPPLHSDIAVAS